MKRTLKIIITAGPTREPIDPARFISNYSTGKMGLALAHEAKKRNHQVILIHGPLQCSPNGMPNVAYGRPGSSASRRRTQLFATFGIKKIPVNTATEMLSAVKKYFNWCDCLIMAAAVADYRPAAVSKRKIHKSAVSLTLQLVKNPDILKELGKTKDGKILVGFALETEDLLKNAKEKLVRKHADIIVGNGISRAKSPFGETKNSYKIIDRAQDIQSLNSIKKEKLAKVLFDKIEKMAW
ncbi:MAG: phosphopantothenoylcysteine decarboxylase [Candidatus Omnitrophota bacterium]